MRAEQILEVLTNDERYKKKVDELRALEVKWLNAQTIATTVESAQKLEQEAVKLKEKASKLESELTATFALKTKELQDQIKNQKSELEAKTARDREQFAGVRRMLEEVNLTKKENEKSAANLVGREAVLSELSVSLSSREKQLADKIKRINDAWSKV